MKKKSKSINKLDIREIFKEGGVLSKGDLNYKERPEQIKAAERIDLALKDNKHFILEGGCGFGKSLAYLVPSIKQMYKKEGKREKIVVVTSNISLQEQLITKDIPFVIDKFKAVDKSRNIKYTSLKGISNFACMHKVEQYISENTLLDELDDKKKEDKIKVKEFIEKSKTGDLNDADFTVSNELKKLITCADSNECERQDCSELNKGKCFYGRQKSQAKFSDIVVTNYHMLYALTEVYSDTLSDASIIIFDEAHEAEDILRELKATEVKETSIDYVLRMINAVINKCSEDFSEYFSSINSELAKDYTYKFFDDIKAANFSDGREDIKLIRKQSDLPECENFKIYMKKIIKAIAIFINELKSDSQLKKENADAINMARKLKKTCYKIYDCTCNVDEVLTDPNKVIWIENRNGTTIVGYKDVDVSQDFHKMYLDFEEVRCILTSATISANGNFEYLKDSLGLNYLPEDRVDEFLGSTPFDLENQELWYLPIDAVSGSHRDFEVRMKKQIRELIECANGGVLALFTSTRNMNICKEYLKEKLPNYTILTQGDMSKKKILEKFKNDKNASLLATKSFFTGVDVQGSSLRCVIIDKLPFVTPTDPVNQKLNEQKNAFYKYSLPNMIITLKQGIGRGVRTVDDKCIITVLDERIATARYKDVIFRSFKYKKTSTRDLDQVRKFVIDNFDTEDFVVNEDIDKEFVPVEDMDMDEIFK